MGHAVGPGGKPNQARGRQQVVGDGMVVRFDDVKQGDLAGNRKEFMIPDKDPKSRRSGVRALLVAWKRGNARGAKGCREMDAK